MDFNIVAVPLFSLWGVALILLFFRGGVSWLWKICALLISVFYVLWFFPELTSSWEMYRSRFADMLIAFLNYSPDMVAMFLFLFWPIALFIGFFSASNSVASGFIRTFVLLSLFYWLFWFVHHTVQPIPVERLRSFLPQRIETPHIPQPPTH